MLTIHLLTIGGLKNAAYTLACADYQKLLSGYCKLVITEIPEVKLGKNPSEAEIVQSLRQEGQLLAAKLTTKAFVIAMCIEGKQFSSAELSRKIEQIAQSNSQIVLLIGGSHGLSSELKQQANLTLSMSAMTFPHHLARVMLLEQLYRAFSITKGSKYHK